MKKSLGDKRNELGKEHIRELVRLYGECQHNATSDVLIDGKVETRTCSKIFDNREFGFLKITVERPLRLNFQASPERIARLAEERAFQNLATSKKRKDEKAAAAEIAAGEEEQQAILQVLESLDGSVLYRSRPAFLKVMDAAFKRAGMTLAAPVKKAVLAALSEQDQTAEICRDRNGNPEPDSDLRDTEIVPLPEDIALPLPLGYDDKTGHDELVKLVREHCETYLKAEVLPHVPDAWIDHSKTKVGYEIPLNRHFYVYQPPRPLHEIEDDIKALEADIVKMLGVIV
uniref:DNA methylase adenine-specific domain-containing protein n=1 Tax=Oscillatoriales cyanobacterium SpSt-402 TaxID=2282168 RepID=A0A832H1V8_9CYAN